MIETSYSQGPIVPVNLCDLLGPALSINMCHQKPIKQEMDGQCNNYFVEENISEQMIVPDTIDPHKLGKQNMDARVIGYDNHMDVNIEDHPIMSYTMDPQISVKDKMDIPMDVPLYRNNQTHLTYRPYMCIHCLECFSCEDYLIQHKIKHTKKYQCNHCGNECDIISTSSISYYCHRTHS